MKSNDQKYSLPLQIRWADLDYNRHLRHSVFYDYGSMARIAFFNEHGLTSAKMEDLHIGPVIFREEALFKREIRLEDKVVIDVELVKSTPDFSRWSLRHHFVKEDGTLAAILNLDGAWVDTTKRKLAIPNDFIQGVFSKFPRAKDFVIAEESSHPSTSSGTRR